MQKFVCFFVVAVISTSASLAEDKVEKPSKPKSKAIPIFVAPLYDSKGPKVDVGPFSKELQAATHKDISSVAEKIKEEWRTLPAEVMYVTAIRLYDFGYKDEAVFWFHSAKYRARVLQGIVSKEAIGGIGDPAFECQHALSSFAQFAGQYINGYAFGDLDNLGKSLEKVLEENEDMVDYAKIYPKQVLIPKEQWKKVNAEVAEDYRKMRSEISDPEFAAQIKAKRIENGVEGKY